MLAAFLACQLSFMAGISQGYSAILLAQLGDADSVFQIDDEQASWIGILPNLIFSLKFLEVLKDKFEDEENMWEHLMSIWEKLEESLGEIKKNY